MPQDPAATIDLIPELQAAIEASQQAAARVAELRKAVLTQDLPRQWSFSHEGYSTWRCDEGGKLDFVTVLARRASIESKLREAVRALPLDRTQESLSIRARATCKLTSETIEVCVDVAQDEPECVRAQGHDWARMYDERHLRDFPGGRRITEGCPHCDGRKTTIFPDATLPETQLTYEAPHHYTEGWVRQVLADRIEGKKSGGAA